MLEKLKGLNLDRILDNDEAVVLSAFARQLEAEYEQLGVPVPEWLEKSASTLREEIARRNKASKLARLKELEANLEGYKTVTEKRSEAQRELAEIQKELGMVPGKSRK